MSNSQRKGGSQQGWKIVLGLHVLCLMALASAPKIVYFSEKIPQPF